MYEERLYEKSFVASVIKEVVRKTELIKQRYSVEGNPKDQPLKIALMGIKLFLQLLETSQNFIKLFDNYKHPGSLELALNSPYLLKLLYLEKKCLHQKKKMDQNPHILYTEFLEILVPIFKLAPKSFKDLIPFIDPDLVDFELGQANYVKMLEEYQTLATETLIAQKKPQNFTLSVASEVKNNPVDRPEEDLEEGWLDVSIPLETQTTAFLQAVDRPKLPIEQTIWARPPRCENSGEKAEAECKI